MDFIQMKIIYINIVSYGYSACEALAKRTSAYGASAYRASACLYKINISLY